VILIRVGGGESVPAQHLAEHSLQQRPPPALPLA
jgi:hypothetical protein